MWHWKLQEHESRKSQSSDHDTITWKNVLRLHKTGDKEKCEQMLFFRRHELKSHDYDYDDGLCNCLPRVVSLFFIFGLEMCNSDPKWNGNENRRAWCISVLPRTKLFSLFLNIEKVLQTTATTNGSETHSCQPKSQAAKSKWAKIETGLSLGNRWEMFYFMPGLGRGRARRRRHQL